MHICVYFFSIAPNFSSGNITLVENGVEKEIVRFEQTRINSAKDPYQILNVDDIYVMTITRRENETQDIEDSSNVTVYKMSMREWDAGYMANDCKLLDSITYPTGAQRIYTYEMCEARPALNREFRVKSTYISADGETMNETSYNYTRNMENPYPHSRYPDYSTSITYGDLGTDTYSYDRYNRLLSVYNYVTDDTKEYIYESLNGSNDSAEEISEEPFTDITSKNDGTYQCRYELGRLVWEQRPNAPGVSYSYSAAYSDILKSSTVRRDATHEVKTANTLTEDGKSIARSDILENGVLKSSTYFQYDQYGNVIEEKVTDADGTVLSMTKNEYIYNADASYQVKTWAENVVDADGNITPKIETVTVYDKRGRPISTTDAKGNTTSYTLDTLGRITQQTNSDGTHIDFAYNTQNNVVTVTNENGGMERHSYTPTGLYDSISVRQNGLWKTAYTYSYDNYGRKTGETEYRSDLSQYSAAYTLDNRGRVKSQIIRDIDSNPVSETEFSYETVKSSAVSLTEPSSNEEEYTLNGAYDYLDIYVRNEKDTSVRIEVYGDGVELYSDSMWKGNKYQTINVTGVQTLTLKSTKEINWNRLNLYTGPMLPHKTTIWPRNAENQTAPKIEQYSDAAGRVWKEVLYDAATNKQISETTNRYDRSSNLLCSSIGEQTTTYEYNYQNNLVKQTNSAGNSQTTAYDALGRVVSQTDFMDNTTQFEYDTLGRQIVLHAPFDGVLKATTKNYYDANGNVVKTLVQDNAPGETQHFKKTEFSYDERNRLVTSVAYADENTPNYTQYKYDDIGNVTAMYTGLQAPLNLETELGADMDFAVNRYTYNDLNQLVSVTDGLGQTTQYWYDLAGNVTTTTDRNGTTIQIKYNLWGAPVTQTAVKEGVSQTITNTYDMLGRLTETADDNGTTTYKYDALGRLTTEQIGNIMNSYTYDIYGNRTDYTIKQDDSVLSNTQYSYNNLNQLILVENPEALSWTTYTYNANGQVLLKEGNNYLESYTYNAGGLLTEKTSSNGSGTLLSDSYSYNLDGNIRSRNDSKAGVTQYTYDGMGRLTAEQNNQDNVTNSYTYDDYGNRASALLGGQAVSYTYDKNNRLTQQSMTLGNSSVKTLYSYDPNGNRISSMTSAVASAGTGEAQLSLTPQLETAYYAYDAYGRLTASDVAKDGVTTVTQYSYNASGQRTSKTVNGVCTDHILDGANVAMDITDGQATQYMRGLDLAVLIGPDGALQYVTDGHGDVRGLVNSAGAYVEDYTYDAFGNQTSETEGSNPFRYAGEYYDEETGLIYLRARYYDSSVGAFTQEDTHWNVGNMIYGDDPDNVVPSVAAILQSGNLYLYCMGNPVNLWDMLGTVAYEKFKTREEALKDWAWNYYGITDYTSIELSSILYYGYDENGALYYSYTWANVGDFHDVDPFVALEWMPGDVRAVATIHSHPNGENISESDKTVAKNSNLDSYVVTPDQKIRRYGLNRQDTKWVESVVVSYAPVAPLSDARKAELRAKFENKWRQHQLNGCSWNCQHRTWPRG